MALLRPSEAENSWAPMHSATAPWNSGPDTEAPVPDSSTLDSCVTYHTCAQSTEEHQPQRSINHLPMWRETGKETCNHLVVFAGVSHQCALLTSQRQQEEMEASWDSLGFFSSHYMHLFLLLQQVHEPCTPNLSSPPPAHSVSIGSLWESQWKNIGWRASTT